MTALEASALPQPVVDVLMDHYDPAVVDQIADRRITQVPNMANEYVPYVRVNQDSGSRPALYIPGFSENIVSRSAFAAELGEQGLDLTLPGQNRAGIPEELKCQHDRATTMQARNYLAVLEAEGLTDGVDVITHSYGSLIFDRMQALSADEGKDYFGDSQVVMLAPAGFNEKESAYRLSYRAVRSFMNERNQKAKELPELSRYTLASSKETLADNGSRTVQECLYELANLRVDYTRLVPAVGHLSIMTYAEDCLFPQDLLQPAIAKAVDAGASWSVPYELMTPSGRERSYGGEHAMHDDESFNPSRVANAVMRVLRNGREPSLPDVPTPEIENSSLLVAA